MKSSYIILCLLLIAYFIIVKKYIIILILLILLLCIDSKKYTEEFTTSNFNTLNDMLNMIASGNMSVDNIKVLNNATINNFTFSNGTITYNGNPSTTIANIGGVKLTTPDQNVSQTIMTNYPIRINGITINNTQNSLTWKVN